jgi:hypothetical protein
VANCASCSNALNCDTCNDGFYAFLNFGAPATFVNCFDCQQLNCAPGACTSNVGATAALTNAIPQGLPTASAEQESITPHH